MSHTRELTLEIEPELQGRPPRPVAYTAMAQKVRLFLRLLLIGSVGLVLLLGVGEFRELMALRSSGIQTTARVTGVESYTNRKGIQTEEADYSYLADGKEQDVSDDVAEVPRVGDTQLVTYLPSHPTTHRLCVVDGRYIVTMMTMRAVYLLVALAFFGLILLAAERSYRGHYRLLTDGTAVRGVVTSQRTADGKSTLYYLTYQFPTAMGTQTKEVCVEPSFFAQQPPGSSLTVLYAPKKPGNSQPYRMLTDVRLTKPMILNDREKSL